MDHKLKSSNMEETDNFCCGAVVASTVNEKVIKSPNNLVIYLERVLEEDGYKKVLNKHVSFEMENYVMNGEKFNLTGVTAIVGGSKNIQYKTYIMNSSAEWVEYDGEIAKVVKKSVVQKVCAITLYYSKNSAS